MGRYGFNITADFVQHHPDLFVYKKAEHVFPHDSLMAKTVLRLLPKQVTPNQVTGLRVLLTPLVIWLISTGHFVIGVILFVATAFTDVIDGSLARTRHKITTFGMLFDPIADKLLIGSLVLLLVFQHFHYSLGISVLGMEIVFVMTALIAKVRFHTVKAANLWGKVKMMLQVLAVFFTLVALVLSSPALLTLAAWTFGLAIGFAVLSLFTHGI